MGSKFIAYLTLFIGVLSISTSAIFVKIAAAPAAITAFYRLFFVVLILAPIVLLDARHRKEIVEMTPKHRLLAFISGGFLSVHYVLWFESLNYTSVASSTVLVTLQPLFSLVGCYFLFNERFSKTAVIGCSLAILGCFIIGWGDFQISGKALLGDFMALIAASMIAMYFMIGQQMRQTMSAVPYSFVGYVSSSIILSLYAFSQNISFINYSLKTWGAFLGLSVIATILGQMSFNWLLKWFSASVISMCILGEVIGTSILAYFILNETIMLQQGIGIFIILFGLSLFLIEEGRKKRVPSPTQPVDAVDF